MDYRHYVVNDSPAGAWTLFGRDFMDYSGNGNHVYNYVPGTPASTGSGGATIPAVPASGVVLPPVGDKIVANDDDGSLRVGGSTTVTVPSTVLDPGREREPFSVEAWFKPDVITGSVLIFGRAGISDGITYNGDKITFSTVYSVSGQCQAVYYPRIEDQVFYVVGVHEEGRNLLYVNAELVAVTELTDEQQTDKYSPAAAPSTLSAGASSGADSLTVYGLATYKRALSAETISAHYANGLRIADSQLIASLYGGTFFDLRDVRSSPARSWQFDSAEDWALGVFTNTTLSGEVLIPTVDDAGLTQAGKWLYGDIISDPMVLAGSKIEWDSDGPVTVETSLDGTTWLSATNGLGVPGINNGYNAQGTTLSVRVSFPAGNSGTVRLKSLKVTTYTNLSVKNSNATQQFVPVGNVTLGSSDAPPISRTSDTGAKFGGGRAYITPHADGTRVVEGWFKLISLPATALTVFDSGSDTTNGGLLRWTGTAWTMNLLELYVNGAYTTSPNFVANRFYHLTFVLPASVTTPIYLGSTWKGTETADLQISSLSTYSSALTASQIGDLYGSYVGLPSLVVRESTVLKVADSAIAPKIYSYAWSITSA